MYAVDPKWNKEQIKHQLNMQILIMQAEANPYDYGQDVSTLQ